MAPRAKYDVGRFRKLVAEGKTKAEIMDEMSIKSHPTFNNLMLKLIVTDKKFYEVKEKKKAKPRKIQKANIGKRNTLTLSAKVLEGSNFKPGDSFQVKMTKNKITLTLLEE